MKYDPEFSEFYLMGRKVALQNIQNGRSGYTIEDFHKEFSHIELENMGDKRWSAFSTGANEIMETYVNSISDGEVDDFIGDLTELLKKYRNISITMGCGCCGGVNWSNGKFTRDIGYKIDAIETV